MPKSNDFNAVIQAVLDGERTGSAGLKAKATRKLNAYLDKREKDGKDRKWVLAGVKARLTRIRNADKKSKKRK